MIILKTEQDLQAMRPACAIAGSILGELRSFIRPGVSTREIDQQAAKLIAERGATSAFLGYKRYPNNVCISVNEEVVHGLAGDRQVEFGDIVSLDVGIRYNGFIGDTAATFAVGGCSLNAQRLLDVTEHALGKGIEKAIVGNRVTDISRAIQNYVEDAGFSVVREFVGHGVGRSVHEDPQIPNYVDGRCNQKLRHGMTVAIEPMVNVGRADVKILNDGWTVVTTDGQLSAHFEHTVLIADGGPEILTWRPLS